jgi:hypothetical protein
MNKNQFPTGWAEEQVKQVLAHYETQSEMEAVAEDEQAFDPSGHAIVEVPVELMPVIREAIAQYKLAKT